MDIKLITALLGLLCIAVIADGACSKDRAGKRACAKLKKYCSNKKYEGFMRKKCCKTCDFAPLPPGPCKDTRDCGRYKHICDNKKYRKFMKKNCCVTCKFGTTKATAEEQKKQDAKEKDEACVDRQDCTRLAAHCDKKQYKEYMDDQCCATCSGKNKRVEEEKKVAAKKAAMCDDKQDCKNIKSMCTDPKYKAWMQQKCCGTCTAQANKPTPTYLQDGGDPAGNLAKACLAAHNEERAKHKDTPAVVYDATIGAAAQFWAEQNANAVSMYHSTKEQRLNLGENLAFSFASSGKGVGDQDAVKDATVGWYREIDLFKGCDQIKYEVLHYTQVTWKNTVKIGCGVARKNGYTYVATRYEVAGNTVGAECENVLPLK